MTLTREKLERQLEKAKTGLQNWESQLEQQGIQSADRRSNTKWRSLKARCSKLNARIAAVAAVEQQNKDLAQRRADKGQEGEE